MRQIMLGGNWGTGPGKLEQVEQVERARGSLAPSIMAGHSKAPAQLVSRSRA